MSSKITAPRRKRSNHVSHNHYDSDHRRVSHKRNRDVQQRPRQEEGPVVKHNVRTKSTTYNGPTIKPRDDTGNEIMNTHQRSQTNTNENMEQQDRQKRTRKVYRRKKVFRKWVFLAVFLVPLGMIWLEYYIGKLIDLEDLKDAYQEQLYDPWDLLHQDFNSSRMRERGNLPFLPSIAYAPNMDCPPGQRRMLNIHNPSSHTIGTDGRLIPMIVHQQSKTRCLTMKVEKATIKWAMRRWSYYMHDEVSRSRLFDKYCGSGIPTCEFPLLNQIVSNCFHNQTDSRSYHRYDSLKVELWKFLTLWIYGGVYVDINFEPVKFSPTTIGGYDDGFLLIDSDTHMLSTKFMAISPRHPIMYYAVQQMLLGILMEESTSSPVETMMASGSSILTLAFRMFQEEVDDVGGENKIISPGVFRGVMKRTVRIVSSSGLNMKTHTHGKPTSGESNENHNGLFVSIFQSENEKEAEYQKMGMTADSDDEEGNTAAAHLSCRQKLYHFTFL